MQDRLILSVDIYTITNRLKVVHVLLHKIYIVIIDIINRFQLPYN